MHTEDMMVEAPAYIWAYVQSQTGTKSEEDFVVIAHNSPYVRIIHTYLHSYIHLLLNMTIYFFIDKRPGTSAAL